MALPVFDALQARYPDVQVHVLSNYPVLFRDNPHVQVCEATPAIVDRYVLLRGASRFSVRLQAYCRKLGLPVPSTLPEIRSSDWSLPTHLRMPRGKGPLVALAGGASWPSKRWPRDRWRALGVELAQIGCRVVVLGQSGEGLPCGWDLTGQTTVDDAARVLHAADLLVCCDSGLMHLALAAGTPVVALFGPTDPEILIRNDDRFTAVCSTSSCHGFWNHADRVGDPGVCPEGHENCLDSIQAEQVAEVVVRRLDGVGAP
jgi:ADP-heptose:LPS heptosyltransferase